ncbi:MAG: sigma-54 dependent transcriptional regulator [Candidatus Cloacimonetes bacterium]|nr:sigma-54 dependent transcriptional regulator [Candidatus Cloacimonadota bacterium]MCF7815230.1 sigma-54 dependent transcriptional regulator [Candidatus Cloacimonadota bacterium]MCF7869391.1 sigma-54 dependent transcriptional regulator [Candidatus Cloacimonadota bacterium]MCF7884791.1 sigma-54 dependent transcriptional regulator [Candidatus Cloacimonadota bacterium]
MNKILIIDDNQDMTFLLSNILKDKGYKVYVAGNGLQGYQKAKRNNPDLVLLDMRLPEMNGIEVLEKLMKLPKEMQVIMITAYADLNDAVKAMKLGAYDYVTKPFNNDELLLTIDNALRTINLSQEVKDLKKKLGQKTVSVKEIGDSSAIQNVFKQVDLIAKTNMSIILQGKSGSGKEVFANLIHQRSPRSGESFVAVDCGAIPANLLESEFFGHERGAFTGAYSTKSGKFEESDGGTLLLDEITNLPLDGQAKLLRAIETKQVRHLGGRNTIDFDVRLIATTNKNIKNEVIKGNFREDLYHRLNEFTITLPTLQERRDDIQTLAEVFLTEANEELEKKVKGFTKEAMKQMLNHEWPGNVRELKFTIKRAALLTNKDYIEPYHLSFALNYKFDSNTNSLLLENGLTFDELVEDYERKILENTLNKTERNKTKTAKMLGLNRKTLYRKLKALDIEL